MDSGLPAWAEQHGITLRPHLSKAVPFAQLDFVDRCYMQRSDEDNAASRRGSSGSASGGGCSRPDGGARLVDACGSGYAAAGAEQLLPLRVGSYEQFVAPCSCPKVGSIKDMPRTGLCSPVVHLITSHASVQLLPLRVGSHERFAAPCSCPEGDEKPSVASCDLLLLVLRAPLSCAAQDSVVRHSTRH